MKTGKTVADGGFLTGIACGTLAAIIWGAWPVVSKLGVGQSLGPTDIAALRFGVAGLLLLPLIMKKGLGGLRLWQVLLLATGAGIPYVLVTIAGLTFAPAGHSGAIGPAVMLMCTTLGGWWLLGEHPGRRTLGLFTLLGGVLLIGLNNWSAGANGNDSWIGDLLFIGSGVLWASYTVLVKRWSVPPLHATALVAVTSMIAYLPLYLVATGGVPLRQAPWQELLLQGGFQGICASFLALLLYSKAVSLLGAGRGAIFSALVPGAAIVFAYPILGETPGPLELAGMALVTLGMIQALGLIRRRRLAAISNG